MQALVFEADGSKELRTVLKQHVKASTVCNHPRQKPAEITSAACVCLCKKLVSAVPMDGASTA